MYYGMDATMYRLILLVFAVHAACDSAAIGNDYVLRIDTMGYTDEATDETEPCETTLRSIEVIARPHFPFHGRVSIGAETLSISGKLRPADKGEFVVQLQYEHSFDTGMAVPGDDGTPEPVIGRSSLQTAISIHAGTYVDIGGLTMKNAKIRYVVLLREYGSLND